MRAGQPSVLSDERHRDPWYSTKGMFFRSLIRDFRICLFPLYDRRLRVLWSSPQETAVLSLESQHCVRVYVGGGRGCFYVLFWSLTT